MEAYSLELALLDFVPNLAFLTGAYFLLRLTRRERGAGVARLLLPGVGLVFLGGFLKATWKLLYSLGVGDVSLLSNQQFILLAPGFLLMLVSIIRVARPAGARATPLLAMALWKIPFLFTMVLCSLGVHGILANLAFQRAARLAAAGFILAFLCTLAMGGLASGEQTVLKQWLEESVNSVGQLGFLAGSYLLDRQSRAAGAVHGG